MTIDLPGGTDHPSWTTALLTAIAYGLVLAVMFALLFVVPYGLFSMF